MNMPRQKTEWKAEAFDAILLQDMLSIVRNEKHSNTAIRLYARFLEDFCPEIKQPIVNTWVEGDLNVSFGRPDLVFENHQMNEIITRTYKRFSIRIPKISRMAKKPGKLFFVAKSWEIFATSPTLLWFAKKFVTEQSGCVIVFDLLGFPGESFFTSIQLSEHFPKGLSAKTNQYIESASIILALTIWAGNQVISPRKYEKYMAFLSKLNAEELMVARLYVTDPTLSPQSAQHRLKISRARLTKIIARIATHLEIEFESGSGAKLYNPKLYRELSFLGPFGVPSLLQDTP